MAKVKDPESLVHILSELINLVKDLMYLAESHNIESQLYYGDGLQRIYGLLDDVRLTRWLRIVDENWLPKEVWVKFVQFLIDDQRLQHQKI